MNLFTCTFFSTKHSTNSIGRCLYSTVWHWRCYADILRVCNWYNVSQHFTIESIVFPGICLNNTFLPSGGEEFFVGIIFGNVNWQNALYLLILCWHWWGAGILGILRQKPMSTLSSSLTDFNEIFFLFCSFVHLYDVYFHYRALPLHLSVVLQRPNLTAR